MTQKTQQLNTKLINQTNQQPQTTQPQVKVTFAQKQKTYHNMFPQTHYQPQGMEIRKPNTIPAITLTGLFLIILCPVLISAHVFIAHMSQIPIIQYIFVTLFISFLVNYVFLIRKYQISPFIIDSSQDNYLKLAILFTFIGILCTIHWGWNGTGGILFAIIYDKLKGGKVGSFTLLYLLIIAGSLIMQKHFSIMKLVEFIPGLLFGIANSIVSQLKQASTYTVAHQFILFISICMPMFFPATHLIVPNMVQWLVMVITGLSIYFTILCMVKLMQKQKVSVVSAVMTGLVMVGTSSYYGITDIIGAFLIVVSVIFIIKREFLDLQF